MGRARLPRVEMGPAVHVPRRSCPDPPGAGEDGVMAREYETTRFTVNLGGRKLFTCPDCSAIVRSRREHDAWHADLARQLGRR